MQSRAANLWAFLSALMLTLACGSAAVWLVLENPMLADKLFYTALGLFSLGAGGIIGLISTLDIYRPTKENPRLRKIRARSSGGMKRRRKQRRNKP